MNRAIVAGMATKTLTSGPNITDLSILMRAVLTWRAHGGDAIRGAVMPADGERAAFERLRKAGLLDRGRVVAAMPARYWPTEAGERKVETLADYVYRQGPK